MFGFRIDYGPLTVRQSAILNISYPLIGLIFFAMVGGLYLWRLHHFPHAVATIESVWNAETHGRNGTTVITMAELTFARTSPKGETIPCKYTFRIGKPDDGFKVGDKLEVVPATGTCQRADIIGRSIIVR